MKESIEELTSSDTIGFDGSSAENLVNMFELEDKKEENWSTKLRPFETKMRRMKLYHFKVLQLRQYEDVIRRRNQQHL